MQNQINIIDNQLKLMLGSKDQTSPMTFKNIAGRTQQQNEMNALQKYSFDQPVGFDLQEKQID